MSFSKLPFVDFNYIKFCPSRIAWEYYLSDKQTSQKRLELGVREKNYTSNKETEPRKNWHGYIWQKNSGKEFFGLLNSQVHPYDKEYGIETSRPCWKLWQTDQSTDQSTDQTTDQPTDRRTDR